MTFCDKMSATIIGVKISQKVRFNGWTSFFRATGFKIRIVIALLMLFVMRIILVLIIDVLLQR